MPRILDDKHVKLCGGIVVWDGVTQPEIQKQGDNAGKPKWSLKCVFDPNSLDVREYDNLARQALAESKWRGNLPPGARMPIGVAQANEFNGMFTGWPVISFKTSLRMPDIYDEFGAPFDTFKLNQLLFPGQRVDVLAHCYEYDAAGNRGISAGLDAFAIIASANMPRLQIAGGVNTAGAFGGGGAPQGGAPGYNQQQPAGYGGGAPANYGAPQGGAAPGYNPNPQNSAPAAANSYQANPYGTTQAGGGSAPGATTYPSNNQQYPSQAHDFLPQGGGGAPQGGAPGYNQQQQQPIRYTIPDGRQFTEAELLQSGWPIERIRALPQS